MKIRHVFGIDMGTGAIKIYDRSSDTITKEMNMIAVRDPGTVFAVGNDAYEMYEKNPENIQIITPMSSGRITDVLMMEAVLHTLLKKCSSFVGYMPTLVFSVPLDMTELERRAYSTIARKGRFRRSRIYFVEKPVADALAIGLPIQRAEGVMVVNIGAQSTEVSILSEGKIIISRLIDIGGDSFNTAIVEGVRRRNRLSVSRRTAQRLKYTLSNLTTDPGEGCKVSGVDAASGLPRDGIVSSYTVSGSVAEAALEIAEEIHRLLERIPPQIQAAVSRDGIYLTGGSTRIPGIDRFLQERLSVPVHASTHYEFGTVNGLKRIIRNSELRHWAVLQTARSGRMQSI